MASDGKICFFCTHVLDVPQDSKMCDGCYTAFTEGTFCNKYHRNEAGWKGCSSCKRQLHLGCLMALNSYDVTEACGATCKYCVKQKSLQASHIGASNYVSFTGQNVQGLVTLLNNDPPHLGNAAHNLSHSPYPGLTFLFSKELSATDCNRDTGRLLLPKCSAEAFLPMPPGDRKMPVVIKDTEGRTWNFTQRWLVNKNSRAYVLDGLKNCIRQMDWNVGDKLKFYRQLPEDELVMEQKAQPTELVLSD